MDAKHSVDLEIERLNGQLNVMKHIKGDPEVLKQVEKIQKELREKEEEKEDMESLNQTLVVQERKSNDELQDARKELIEVSMFCLLQAFHQTKILMHVKFCYMVFKHINAWENFLYDG